MNATDYFLVDTSEDAVASFELASVFLTTAQQDSRYWKWFLVSFHAGLQGTFALALGNGNPVHVQKPNVTKKMIAAQNDNSLEPPAPSMDRFEALYQKIQIHSNLRFHHSIPFAPTASHTDAITSLNAYRNEFIHFNVKSWGIHVKSLLDRCLSCLEIAEFLHSQSNSILWYAEENRQRMTASLKVLREAISTCRSSLNTTPAKS